MKKPKLFTDKPRTFSFDLIKGKQVKVTYFNGYVITGTPVEYFEGGWFNLADSIDEEGLKWVGRRITLSHVKNIKFI